MDMYFYVCMCIICYKDYVSIKQSVFVTVFKM